MHVQRPSPKSVEGGEGGGGPCQFLEFENKRLTAGAYVKTKSARSLQTELKRFRRHRVCRRH